MNYRASAKQGIEKSEDEVDRVVCRQNRQISIALPELGVGVEMLHLSEIVAVRHHATFRAPAGARRIENRCNIVLAAGLIVEGLSGGSIPADSRLHINCRVCLCDKHLQPTKQNMVLFVELIPIPPFGYEHLRNAVPKKGALLGGTRLVIQGDNDASCPENTDSRQEPLRLVRHENCAAVPWPKTFLLEERGHTLRFLCHLVIRQPDLFLISVD